MAEAMALFRLGRFDEGWQRYLWRQDRNALRERYPRLAMDPAALRGAGPLRIAVHSEQGIGDELFFLRFAPALRAKGHRLLLRTNPKMLPLLRTRADLFAEIAAIDEPVEDCDVELQASDLALASGQSFAPSLRFVPDQARQAALASRLAEFGPAPYIGVTWQAGLSGDEAKKWGGAHWSKRIPPAILGEMLRGVRGTPVILQRNPAPADVAALSASAGRAVIDMSAVNDDLLDAIALLALLDDYVGVSNTNMHLLAAIEARTARVVLPLPAEWRWGMSGESPWFPGFRVYRAAQHDKVDDALAELQRDFVGR